MTRYMIRHTDGTRWLTAQGIATPDRTKAALYDTYTGAVLALIMNPSARTSEWHVEPVKGDAEQAAA